MTSCDEAFSSGLQLDALHGGFAREPFTEDSGEYVFVASRPSA